MLSTGVEERIIVVLSVIVGAGRDPQSPAVGVTNAADAYVAQILRSRTLFSRSPTDLAAVRGAIAAAIVEA